MDILHAILLAIIEGITEYLPISSTGHMIIGASFLGIAENPFTKIFEVNIQFGAILAVIVLYWKRFFQSMEFYYKLFVAFIPAAIIGFTLNDFIDSILENVWVVAFSLLIGGVILIFVDKYFEDKTYKTKPSYMDSLVIGFFQCIAMIPGVSRSASTIIGGMFRGLTRKSSAEMSFFLAVPTMFAASAYKLLKGFKNGDLILDKNQLLSLGIGNLVAFVVAVIAIRFFINFLQKYGFKFFGYYRIALGLVLLGLLISGVDLKIV